MRIRNEKLLEILFQVGRLTEYASAYFPVLAGEFIPWCLWPMGARMEHCQNRQKTAVFR